MRIPKNRAMATVVGLVAAGGITGGAIAVASATTTSSSNRPVTSASSSTSGSSAGSARAPAAPRGAPGARGPYDADGTVSSVSSSSLTIRSFFGTSSTYQLSSSTKVHQGPNTSLTRSAIDTGEHVTVHGSKTSSGLVAVDVDVDAARIDGSVSSINGNSITVQDRDGFTRTISVSSSTKYTLDSSSSSRSALRTGRFVQAEGTVDSNGTTLDATTLGIQTKAPTSPSGGPGGRGGHGPGGFGPGGFGPGGNGPRPGGSAPSGSRPSGAPSGTPSGSPSAQPSNGSGTGS